MSLFHQYLYEHNVITFMNHSGVIGNNISTLVANGEHARWWVKKYDSVVKNVDVLPYSGKVWRAKVWRIDFLKHLAKENLVNQ